MEADVGTPLRGVAAKILESTQAVKHEPSQDEEEEEEGLEEEYETAEDEPEDVSETVI